MNDIEIIIWDDDAGRIHIMEPNLRVALRKRGLDALLARHGLTGNTPAIQVNGGDFWRHTAGEAISADQFEALLGKLQSRGLLD